MHFKDNILMLHGLFLAFALCFIFHTEKQLELAGRNGAYCTTITHSQYFNS